MIRTYRALSWSSASTAPLKAWRRAAASSASSTSKMEILNDTVIVTSACAKRVMELQKKAGNTNLILRLSVEGGGCSGFKYVFKVEPKEVANQQTDSRSFRKDGVEVVVDNDTFDLIKGATIDYTQELIRSSFVVVNNPQSESACGCGSSFAVKNFSSNPALD